LYVEGKLKEQDYEYIEKRVCDKGISIMKLFSSSLKEKRMKYLSYLLLQEMEIVYGTQYQ
jgi:hypothetical protein